jgi:peptidoglycan/xylan/chitin deacetylase (PgdA/CDA1 family)
LLKKYGLPATFFVTTRFLHSAGEYWWDVLARSATQLGEEECQRLHDQFVHATPDERARLLDALQRRAPSVRGDADPRPMFASEIASLAGLHGMTIGAHGVDHLALTDQTDDGMASEVRESRAALETLIGRPVRHFAYPYGAVDDRAANIVRRLVPWALTCEPQALPASFDAARVPRVEITPSRASAFAETLTTMLEMGVTRARRAPATSTEGV